MSAMFLFALTIVRYGYFFRPVGREARSCRMLRGRFLVIVELMGIAIGYVGV